jgi:hypothetical protein
MQQTLLISPDWEAKLVFKVETANMWSLGKHKHPVLDPSPALYEIIKGQTPRTSQLGSF